MSDNPAMDIAQTRLSPPDEDDLRWLLTVAPGEMGERSALGGLLDRLAEGRTHAGQSGSPEIGERAYHAAVRARPIQHRLNRLPEAHQRTLVATYGVGAKPGEYEAYPGIHTSALPLSLLLLTADRLRCRGQLRAAIAATLPAKPARPDTRGARLTEAKDAPDDKAARAAAKADKDAKAEHLRRLVSRVRGAASLALDEACLAYRATRPEAP